MTDGARAFREQPPHGSLAEEAAKLAEVAQQWLRDRSAPGAAEGGDAADDPWAAATDGHDTAPECRTCPICRARRFVRNLDPEVLAHLSDAAASVSAAVQAMSKKREDRPR